jgi:hypothetical protein
MTVGLNISVLQLRFGFIEAKENLLANESPHRSFRKRCRSTLHDRHKLCPLPDSCDRFASGRHWGYTEKSGASFCWFQRASRFLRSTELILRSAALARHRRGRQIVQRSQLAEFVALTDFADVITARLIFFVSVVVCPSTSTGKAVAHCISPTQRKVLPLRKR